MIGDKVTVTILGIVGGSVTVGISAPREIIVDREELYERKQAELKLRPDAAFVNAV